MSYDEVTKIEIVNVSNMLRKSIVSIGRCFQYMWSGSKQQFGKLRNLGFRAVSRISRDIVYDSDHDGRHAHRPVQ